MQTCSWPDVDGDRTREERSSVSQVQHRTSTSTPSLQPQSRSSDTPTASGSNGPRTLDDLLGIYGGSGPDTLHPIDPDITGPFVRKAPSGFADEYDTRNFREDNSNFDPGFEPDTAFLALGGGVSTGLDGLNGLDGLEGAFPAGFEVNDVSEILPFLAVYHILIDTPSQFSNFGQQTASTSPHPLSTPSPS